MAFGPASPIFRAATAWANKNGRNVATWRGDGLPAAMAAVGCAVCADKRAKDVALRLVAPSRSTMDTLCWEELPIAQQLSILAEACPLGDEREILEHLLSQSPQGPQFWTPGRLVALIEVVSEARLPLLFGWLEPFDPASLGWVAELAQLAPALPLLIAAPTAGKKHLDITAHEGDRSCVLLHEGLMFVAKDIAPPNTIESIAAEQPDAMELHAEALAEIKSGRTKPMGRYGSTAEAFLAMMLEAHPLTVGLFESQGEVGFAMRGGQAARVDFLAASLRIAIEVDGPHHLEPIQYRRDRHKDLELQSRGFFVLRFLAEDVAADFERVRSTINRLVLVRQRQRWQPDFGV
jgi:very-short-patch-repair endonuclease